MKALAVRALQLRSSCIEQTGICIDRAGIEHRFIEVCCDHMLTATAEEVDWMAGLTLGAGDHVTKPLP